MDRTIPEDVSAKSVYFLHPTGHYNLVGGTEPNSSNPKQGSTESGDPKSKHKKFTPDDVRERSNWISASHSIQVWDDYRFCSVDVEWQTDKCAFLGLPLLAQMV